MTALDQARLRQNIGTALRLFLQEHPEGVAERVIRRAIDDQPVLDEVLRGFVTAGWIERDEQRIRWLLP